MDEQVARGIWLFFDQLFGSLFWGCIILIASVFVLWAAWGDNEGFFQGPKIFIERRDVRYRQVFRLQGEILKGESKIKVWAVHRGHLAKHLMMGTHRVGEYSKMIDLETVHLMKGGDELEERYGIKGGPFAMVGVSKRPQRAKPGKENAHHC